MAVITPNSDIYLIKCPIELDNLNQLSFANATAQHTYFNSLPKLELTGATFQRKDGTIRWPGSMEDILGYNYCMYRNKNHGNKWFYCFIENMRYVSDSMTDIKIKTDVWQTWGFDLTWKASYVEREHVSDDTVGLHTVPEGLDTGEYVCNDVIDYIYADPDTITLGANFCEFMVCAQVTTLNFGEGNYFVPPTYNIQNSVPQGCYIIAWPLSTATSGWLYTLTGAYDSAGKGDAIMSMFIVPKEIAATWNAYTGQGSVASIASNYYYPADTKGAIYLKGYNIVQGTITSLTVPINSSIDGYTPKNNKLKVGPYNYFTVSNNSGTDLEFYYEDFRDSPNFSVVGCFEQGCNVMCYPTNSKRTTTTADVMAGTGWTEGVIGGKLPQVSWTSDYYLNWEAQNGKNIAIQTALSAAGFAVSTITGFASPAVTNATMRDTAVQRGYFPDEEPSPQVSAGGMVGNVLNFASQIANTQNSIRKAKMVPPQAKGGSVVGTLAYASGHASKFTARKMSVRAEYARQIDDYFSMFGYKVNTLKIPNISGRTNWNYVKTVGCNIIGDVPQGDLLEIKALFDHGITLWHNPTTFLDYSQNNSIV